MITYIQLVSTQTSKTYRYEQSDQVLNIFDNIGPPYWIRHFEFWQSNFRFGFNDPTNLSITNFIQIWPFQMFQVRHIRSAILKFENSTFDLDSPTPKTVPLEIRRDSEVFFLKNIFGTIFFRLTVKGLTAIVAYLLHSENSYVLKYIQQFSSNRSDKIYRIVYI